MTRDHDEYDALLESLYAERFRLTPRRRPRRPDDADPAEAPARRPRPRSRRPRAVRRTG